MILDDQMTPATPATPATASTNEAPTIRDAQPEDAPAVAELLGELGYPDDEAAVRGRIHGLRQHYDACILLAQTEGRVVGLASFHSIPLVHRARPIGRITSLVVRNDACRRGVGTALLAAIDELARDRGCERIEVTSNECRADAHCFYEGSGYVSTSRRFVRDVAVDVTSR